MKALLGIILAAAANMLIGMFWYSPKGFGKQWIKLSGIKKMKKMTKRQMRFAYSYGTFSAIVMASVLAYMASWASSASPITGAGLGVVLWIGFVATVLSGSVLWERKPFKLFAINSSYWLVTLVVMGVIIGATV